MTNSSSQEMTRLIEAWKSTESKMERKVTQMLESNIPAKTRSAITNLQSRWNFFEVGITDLLQRKNDDILAADGAIDVLIYLSLKKRFDKKYTDYETGTYADDSLGILLLAGDPRYSKQIDNDLRDIVCRYYRQYIAHKLDTVGVADEALGAKKDILKTESGLIEVLTGNKSHEEKIASIKELIESDPVVAIRLIATIQKNLSVTRHKGALATALMQSNLPTLLQTMYPERAQTQGSPEPINEIFLENLGDVIREFKCLRLSVEKQLQFLLWCVSHLEPSSKKYPRPALSFAFVLDPSIQTIWKNWGEEKVNTDQMLKQFRQMHERLVRKREAGQAIAKQQAESLVIENIVSGVENTDISYDLLYAIGEKRVAINEAVVEARFDYNEWQARGYRQPRGNKYNPYAIHGFATFAGAGYVHELAGVSPEELPGFPQSKDYEILDRGLFRSGKRNITYEEAKSIANYFKSDAGMWLRTVFEVFASTGNIGTSSRLVFESQQPNKLNEASKQVVTKLQERLSYCISLIDTHSNDFGQLPEEVRIFLETNLKVEEFRAYIDLLDNALQSSWDEFAKKYRINDSILRVSQDGINLGVIFRPVIARNNEVGGLDIFQEQVTKALIIDDIVKIDPATESIRLTGAVSPSKVDRATLRTIASRADLPNVAGQVPQNIDIPLGKTSVMTGPTGAGKTHYLTLCANLALVEKSMPPYCEEVILPDGGIEVMWMPTPSTATEASLWGNQCETMSQFLTNVAKSNKRHQLLFIDELGRGTDAEQAQSIIHAWLTTVQDICKRQDKVLTVVYTTHDADMLVTANEIVKKGSAQPLEIDPRQFTPSQEIVPGLSESYGFYTLERAGMPAEIIDLIKSWLDCEAMGILPQKPELSLDLEKLGGQKYEGVATAETLVELGFEEGIDKSDILSFLASYFGEDISKKVLLNYKRIFFRKAMQSKEANQEDKDLIDKLLQKEKENSQMFRSITSFFSRFANIAYTLSEDGYISMEDINLMTEFCSDDEKLKYISEMFHDFSLDSEYSKIQTLLTLPEKIAQHKQRLIEEARSKTVVALVAQILNLPFTNGKPNITPDVSEWCKNIINTRGSDTRLDSFAHSNAQEVAAIKDLVAEHGQNNLTFTVESLRDFISQEDLANVVGSVDRVQFPLLSAGFISRFNGDSSKPNGVSGFNTQYTGLRELMGSNSFHVSHGINLATFAYMKEEAIKRNASIVPYIPVEIAMGPVDKSQSDPRYVFLEGENTGGKTSGAQNVGQILVLEHVFGRAPAMYTFAESVKRVVAYLNPAIGEEKEGLSSFENLAHVMRKLIAEIAANEGSFVIIDEPWMGAGQKTERVGMALMAFLMDKLKASGGIFPTHAHSAVELARQVGTTTPTRIAISGFIQGEVNGKAPASQPEKALRRVMSEYKIESSIIDAMIGVVEELGGLAGATHAALRQYEEALIPQ